MDLSLLKKNKRFRNFYIGQFISQFGGMMTYAVVPYHIYKLTHSTAITGLLGMVQLLPLVFSGLIGGVLADSLSRRALILICESVLFLLCLSVALASFLRLETAAMIFAYSGLSFVFFGVHRPAHEAIGQKLVDPQDMSSAGALQSFRHSICAICGPSFAGILVANYGVGISYLIDGLTYLIAIVSILNVSNFPSYASETSIAGFKAFREGVRYALARQDLLGTYFVDIVAMAFCMPTVLFPAIAEAMGGPQFLGWLHAAIPTGALLAILTSGWTKKEDRHGMMILLAAFSWCVAVFMFSLVNHFLWAFFFLSLAGFADSISAIFRSTIWNQTIPDSFRGRLAGVEMISYMSGPLVGNTQLGFLASMYGPLGAVFLSSSIGIVGILACGLGLPRFRKYRSQVTMKTSHF